MAKNTSQIPYSFATRIRPGFAKIVEETGELLEVIGKMMMVGGQFLHWKGSLRKKLHDELADVAAAVEFYTSQPDNMTEEELRAFFARKQAKIIKFEKWQAKGDDIPDDPFRVEDVSIRPLFDMDRVRSFFRKAA